MTLSLQHHLVTACVWFMVRHVTYFHSLNSLHYGPCMGNSCVNSSRFICINIVYCPCYSTTCFCNEMLCCTCTVFCLTTLKLYAHGMCPVRFLGAWVWFRDVTSFSDVSGLVCVRVEVSLKTCAWRILLNTDIVLSCFFAKIFRFNFCWDILVTEIFWSFVPQLYQNSR